MYDGPKTVTFNPTPADEAQHRSARLGSRIIGGTLGVAASLLAIVALLMSWAFTASLAVSWGEVIKLGLIGSALVAALSGLPVASAMMSRSYPQESSWAIRAWLLALLVVAASAVVFTWRLERPSDKALPSRLVARPLAAPAVPSPYMTTELWRDSSGCTAPRTLYHEEMCGEYRHALAARGVSENREVAAETAPFDWSPSATLGVASLADGAARQAIVLFLVLVATGGAGVLGRWATLAMSESYRLGIGEAAPLPVQPSPRPALPAPDAVALMTPMQAFDMWFQGRVKLDPDGLLAASGAYADYHETCRTNRLPPLSGKGFGDLLTAKAVNSGGRIEKIKRSGVFYKGLAFAGDIGLINGVGAPGGKNIMEAIPHRT